MTERDRLPRPPAAGRPPVPGDPRRPEADFRRVCPNCGASLYERSCKSRCPRCHFFTDCSDPW